MYSFNSLNLHKPCDELIKYDALDKSAGQQAIKLLKYVPYIKISRIITQ